MWSSKDYAKYLLLPVVKGGESYRRKKMGAFLYFGEVHREAAMDVALTTGRERILRSDRQKCGGVARSCTSGKYLNESALLRYLSELRLRVLRRNSAGRSLKLASRRSPGGRGAKGDIHRVAGEMTSPKLEAEPLT